MMGSSKATQSPSQTEDDSFDNPLPSNSSRQSANWWKAPPPSYKNPINIWYLNTYIKTCKCETCDERVKKWSYQCDDCSRRICSECLDPNSDRRDEEKVQARDHIEEGCWHRFASNMNPRFAQRDVDFSKLLKKQKKSKKQKGSGDTEGNTKCTKRKVSGKNKSEDDLEDDLASEKPTKIQRKELKPTKDSLLSAGTTAADSLHFTLQHLDPSAASARAAHLAGGSTVIVGAGFVGLFAGFELALEAKKAKIEHQITIIDIRDKYCELASGHCAGFLTTDQLPVQWQPIAEKAKEFWQMAASCMETRQKLAFGATSSLSVAQAGHVDQEKAPSWLQGGSEVSFLEDLEAFGRIDPAKLAMWLYEQCTSCGVEFRFGYKVSEAKFAANYSLSSIQIQDVKKENQPAESLTCHNLVLAAGPFTTGVFNDLFPDSPLVLESHVQGMQWFHAPHPTMTDNDVIGLRFLHAGSSDHTIEDEIVMVAHPSEKTIVVAGLLDPAEHRDLHPVDALQETKYQTNELRNVAASYLTIPGSNFDDEMEPEAAGKSYLCTANRGCPIIDRVPASGLVRSRSPSEDNQLCGVWLSYGLGNLGTMLAPGAGRMLVAKMLGGSYGMQEQKFGIPKYSK